MDDMNENWFTQASVVFVRSFSCSIARFINTFIVLAIVIDLVIDIFSLLF